MFHVKPPEIDPEDLAAPPSVAGEIFGANLDRAVAYHRSLATDGAVRGFIGPREMPRLWDRHILNCAVLGDVIPRNEGLRVADIGSGAGLPGIPLALARPDLDITLIEPLLKRSTYLSEIVDDLRLDNVTVVRGRAEEKAVRERVGQFRVVTSRAVAPLGKLAGWSLPLVARGGEMMALKGTSVKEELDRDFREITRAGGGRARIITAGEGLIDEPATVIVIPRRK
ncbi:16S rRNA (guanine(527)-N(7))-methyltransferase RsmG [Corynebacterium sp. CCM 9185]|uniref:Ribosomal RNA small subunit methyltransferase G n=1 Tax=Corynebacterium marambiense TaxID=2765364 RepID=A0ABS0VWU7_9CORY|nr:16S rRNA (guanine(527)-N(7))-methyltransferase RsmG [Corynebacterium marambiense]MBI8999817.1 16S rRNA (guanine(527)-N(7))-methyltransferase RsmG [Corynebacterium marambiense]MCK7662656.1 16S rRNA (guanine(527)-N(7))-methyltransferase RsmG [Corynebacterium marambiense]MCX7543667.1 16S rRNA (guanine(527)-N(7))-methyltransferase RsmG [Corynebacterium marambiense]